MKHTHNAASDMRIVERPWGFSTLSPEFFVDGVLVCTIDTASWTVDMHVAREFTDAERAFLIAWRAEREAIRVPAPAAIAPKPAAAGLRLHLVPQGVNPYAFAASLGVN